MSAGRSRGEHPTGDRLAVVLRLRRLEEDRARLALAAALAVETAIRDRLDGIRAEHAAACGTLATLLGGPVGAASVAELTAAMEVLEARRRRLTIEHEAAVKAVGEARTRLALTSRRREAVERLRNRRLAEHRREVERRLERELTEIALVRYARAVAAELG
jgi:flagellar FliJ protein